MHETLRLGLAIELVMAAGCGPAEKPLAGRSVTVQLPPPRPPIAEPGFSLSSLRCPANGDSIEAPSRDC